MLSNRFLILLLIIGLAVFAVGCSDDDDDDDPPAVDEFTVLTDAGDVYYTSYTTTGGMGVNVTIDQVFDWLTNSDTSDDPFLIDWRAAEDYQAAHIMGAVNWAIGDLDDHFDDLPQDQLIVNICYSGQNASYATATMNLLAQDPDYAGIEAVNLKFAMCAVTTDTDFIPKTDRWMGQVESDEWVNALETTPHTLTTEYDFPMIDTGYSNLSEIIEARFDDALALGGGWGISADEVFSNSDNYFVVNYWPEDRYLDPGHVPGAYYMAPGGDLQQSAKLKYLPTDQTIVVYCYTGQTSAQVVAYLRLLGYDAKSLLYGTNGFAYDEMVSRGWPNYHEPTNDYSAIITTGN